MSSKSKAKPKVNPAQVNAAAFSMFPAIVKRWFPDGMLRGKNWEANSPSRGREGRKIKIDLLTCRWIDYGTGAKGQGAVSLAAHVASLDPQQAAIHLASMLGFKA